MEFTEILPNFFSHPHQKRLPKNDSPFSILWINYLPPLPPREGEVLVGVDRVGVLLVGVLLVGVERVGVDLVGVERVGVVVLVGVVVRVGVVVVGVRVGVDSVGEEVVGVPHVMVRRFLLGSSV